METQTHRNIEVHDHHAMMIADFRRRFYVVSLLTIPVMLLSMQIQQWLGLRIVFIGSNYVLFALSTAIFLCGGWPFLTGLLAELKVKNPGMMTLIGFTITVAYTYSTETVFGLKGMNFFGGFAIDALPKNALPGGLNGPEFYRLHPLIRVPQPAHP